MGNLKKFGSPLTRGEMKSVYAGADPRGLGSGHACGSQLDCRYQSPSFTCNNGQPPVCHSWYCVNGDGSTAMDWRFSCGIG